MLKKQAGGKRFWFSLDTPYKMAIACKSIRPYFTAHQIAETTGLAFSHVAKTLNVWKNAGLIEDTGLGKRIEGKRSKPFYLYSTTKVFDARLEEATAKRLATSSKVEKPELKEATAKRLATSSKVEKPELVETIPSLVLAHLKKISKSFQELDKLIG
jgi:hypothetical protein